MGARVNDDLLQIYLNDHWAGAGLGADLARTLLRHNRGTAWEPALEWLADQIAEDDRTLAQIRQQLGVRGGGLKRAMAVVAEKVRMAKPNGRIVSHSPLSRLIEVEALLIGIQGKHQLWSALQTSLADHPVIGTFDLDRLQQRACDQLEVAQELHGQAARLAFDAGADADAVLAVPELPDRPSDSGRSGRPAPTPA